MLDVTIVGLDDLQNEVFRVEVFKQKCSDVLTELLLLIALAATTRVPLISVVYKNEEHIIKSNPSEIAALISTLAKEVQYDNQS